MASPGLETTCLAAFLGMRGTDPSDRDPETKMNDNHHNSEVTASLANGVVKVRSARVRIATKANTHATTANNIVSR